MSGLACNIEAIPAEGRESHSHIGRELFAAVIEKYELADGYRFRFPAESTILKNAAAFIANERLCCPFFRFELIAEPDGGPFWLQLTGPEGVKELLDAELGV